MTVCACGHTVHVGPCRRSCGCLRSVGCRTTWTDDVGWRSKATHWCTRGKDHTAAHLCACGASTPLTILEQRERSMA